MNRTAVTLALLALGACSSGPPAPVPVASRTPAPGGAGDLRPLSSRETAPPDVTPRGAGEAAAEGADPVDPAEPGLTDLARLARYVFRTMRAHEDACPFENPYRDRIHFLVEVEVKAGKMTRVGLGHAGVGAEEHSHELAGAQSPPELVRYVECLAPHLRAVTMSPAPADGRYEPAYQYPGRESGRAVP